MSDQNEEDEILLGHKICSYYRVYEVSEIRALFEREITLKTTAGIDLTKLITNSGLVYKDSNIESIWQGFLMFAVMTKMIPEPGAKELIDGNS